MVTLMVSEILKEQFIYTHASPSWVPLAEQRFEVRSPETSCKTLSTLFIYYILIIFLSCPTALSEEQVVEMGTK